MPRPEIGKWGRRFPTQILSLIAFNGYFWRGPGKWFCVPVLNCYACPIGTVACPIGSLTAFALARRIPFYVLGFLGVIGLAVGRAFCGWACPFGFFQDLLYRIRSFKFRLPRAANALKYALLVVLVLGLPLILAGGKRTGSEERITGEQDRRAGLLLAGLPGRHARRRRAGPGGERRGARASLVADLEQGRHRGRHPRLDGRRAQEFLPRALSARRADGAHLARLDDAVAHRGPALHALHALRQGLSHARAASAVQGIQDRGHRRMRAVPRLRPELPGERRALRADVREDHLRQRREEP